jgi:Ca2+-binding RTX toxin-like protein
MHVSARFFEPLESRRLLSASLVNGVLTVTGTELNDVIAISQDKTRVRVNEDGRVTAFTSSLVKRIVVNALGGIDKILGRPNLTKPMTADGGAGRDTLLGGSANDRLYGGAGDDYLDGAKGADLMSGGDDVDHADYSTRSTDLRISLDDVADDGENDERDNVLSDVESLRTGKGNDRVIGSSADNVLYTNEGSDTIYGMRGNDHISTGDTPADTGLDRIYGGDGDRFR